MSIYPLIFLALLALASIYSYLLYPLILLVMPNRRYQQPDTAGSADKLTLIITAHNEEQKIAGKIENSLLLREAIPTLEILVASDASSDATDDIVRQYQDQDVRLVRSPDRNGKEYAQGLAVAEAAGDIIIFTDVGTTVAGDAIKRIHELFQDETVGAVSSEDKLISATGQPVGEGLYVKYEMWLRRLESRKGGLVGLSGSFFATRRAVASEWDTDLPSDFCVAINARRMGYRSVSDPGVVGEYRDIGRSGDESARKIRTVVRGMTAVAKKSAMLNPFRHGLFAFQLFSHKVMRWSVPWFVLAYVVLATFFSLQDPAYWVTLLPVVIGLLAVGLASLSTAIRRIFWISPLYYLYQTNVAVARAGVAFMGGRRITTWSPSKR